jgi:hypothetical protein
MPKSYEDGLRSAASIAAQLELTLQDLHPFAKAHLQLAHPGQDALARHGIETHLSALGNHHPNLLRAASRHIRASSDLVTMVAAATGRTTTETRQRLQADSLPSPAEEAVHDSRITSPHLTAPRLLAPRLTHVIETIRRLDQEIADADVVTCRNCSTPLPAPDDTPCPHGQEHAGQHDPDHVAWEPALHEPPTRRIGVAFALTVPNDGHDYATDVTGRIEQLLALLLLHPRVGAVSTGGPTGSGYTGDPEH